MKIPGPDETFSVITASRASSTAPTSLRLLPVFSASEFRISDLEIDFGFTAFLAISEHLRFSGRSFRNVEDEGERLDSHESLRIFARK